MAAGGQGYSSGTSRSPSATTTWWWADDKDGGHQNHWVQYDAAKQSLLETAWNAKQPRVDVDGVRFVQLNRVNMYQARKDAPDRRRMVERRTVEDDESEDASEDPDGLLPVQQTVPAAAPAALDDDGGTVAAPAAPGPRADAAVAKASASLQGATFCMSGKLSDTVAVRLTLCCLGHISPSARQHQT